MRNHHVDCIDDPYLTPPIPHPHPPNQKHPIRLPLKPLPPPPRHILNRQLRALMRQEIIIIPAVNMNVYACGDDGGYDAISRRPHVFLTERGEDSAVAVGVGFVGGVDGETDGGEGEVCC